jgi:hypothetical protein
MSTLASLHDIQRRDVLINPDHVSMVQSAPGGTLITFSNGGSLMVVEELLTVHGHLNAAILIRKK